MHPQRRVTPDRIPGGGNRSTSIHGSAMTTIIWVASDDSYRKCKPSLSILLMILNPLYKECLCIHLCGYSMSGMGTLAGLG
jgi:hypothetical protein